MENFEFNTLDNTGGQKGKPAPAPKEKPEEKPREGDPKKHTDDTPGQKPAGV